MSQDDASALSSPLLPPSDEIDAFCQLCGRMHQLVLLCIRKLTQVNARLAFMAPIQGREINYSGILSCAGRGSNEAFRQCRRARRCQAMPSTRVSRDSVSLSSPRKIGPWRSALRLPWEMTGLQAMVAKAGPDRTNPKNVSPTQKLHRLERNKPAASGGDSGLCW